MSNNIVVPSMETLPIELLHRIFDNLNAETIIFSMRSLSKLFRSTVNSYDRFTLNMKSTSKAHFHVFCRLIKPENMISLTLSNDECTADQTDLFISLVDLGRLTRLRSLTLLNVDDGQLNTILKQIDHNLLASITFNIRKYDDRRVNSTNNSLIATFAHFNLRQLEFDIESTRFEKFSWPSNCAIQQLKIKTVINMNYLFTILQSCSDLHTIIMKRLDADSKPNIRSFTSLKSFTQLKSLTIEDLNVNIDQLESFLLLTPSVIYLKLIDGSGMVDGKRWEQFIQANLPRLDKFEFFFPRGFSRQPTVENLESVLASFRTSFWTEYKKWFVACEYDTKYSCAYVYSIPLCKSFWRYGSALKTSLRTTYPLVTINEAVMMKNVTSLSLEWNKLLVDCIQEKKVTTNQLLFPQVTEIIIDHKFSYDGSSLSLQSLSILINITQLTRMELDIYYCNKYNEDTLNDIATFFKQTHALSSLVLSYDRHDYEVSEAFEKIYPIIPCQLKHLELPINSVDQVKRILEKCKHLTTIKFNAPPNLSNEVFLWLNYNTFDSSCYYYDYSYMVWIRKINIRSTTNRTNHKRIKLTDNHVE